jgi:hypothetical protein
MRRRDSLTPPAVAPHAVPLVKPTNQKAGMALVAVAATAAAPGRCTRQYAPSATRRPRCPSSPVVTGPCIARIASRPSARAQVRAPAMAIAQVAVAGATRQSSDCLSEGWRNGHPSLSIGVSTQMPVYGSTFIDNGSVASP